MTKSKHARPPGTIHTNAACADEAALLLERLHNGDPALAKRCISQWAHPLDAAILAALLLRQPHNTLQTQQRAAHQDGRAADAAFWHKAADLLDAITSEEKPAQN